MKIKTNRKYIISLTFFIAATVLAGIYYMTSHMNQVKYEKLKYITVISSAENFRDKINKINDIWNQIYISETDNILMYNSIYVNSQIAIEEMAKFNMRDDVRRAVRMYLIQSADVSGKVIETQNAPDSEVIEEISARGNEFCTLFNGADFSEKGELIFSKESVPEKMILKILADKNQNSDESETEMTYYLKYKEDERIQASEKKALEIFGITRTGVLQPAYSNKNSIYYFGNSYSETSEEDNEPLMILVDSEIKEKKLSEEECMQSAAEYLTNQGFSDFFPESYVFIDNVMFIDFFKSNVNQNIRIGVGADTGKVQFFKK